VTWRLHRSQPGLLPEERTLVFNTLRYFDSAHFDLHAAVVMDDHVHAVVTPAAGRLLELIVQTWKATSAAGLRWRKRVAPFWQRGYYDRIVRSPSDLREKISYVASNPGRRWPDILDYPWLWVK
jgi:putative transposase